MVDLNMLLFIKCTQIYKRKVTTRIYVPCLNERNFFRSKAMSAKIFLSSFHFPLLISLRPFFHYSIIHFNFVSTSNLQEVVIIHFGYNAISTF